MMMVRWDLVVGPQYFPSLTHLDNQTCVSTLFLRFTTNHLTREPSETELLWTSYLLKSICFRQVLGGLETISSGCKYFQLFSQAQQGVRLWFRFFHEAWIISGVNVGSLFYFKVANTRTPADSHEPAARLWVWVRPFHWLWKQLFHHTEGIPVWAFKTSALAMACCIMVHFGACVTAWCIWTIRRLSVGEKSVKRPLMLNCSSVKMPHYWEM